MEEIISLTSDEVAARLLKKFKESLARKAAGESSSSELPPLNKVKTEPVLGRCRVHAATLDSARHRSSRIPLELLRSLLSISI